MILSLLEIQLAAICYDTDTPEKCLKGMGGLHELMLGAQGQEAEDLMTVVDLLHAKGNLFIQEQRGGV